MDIQLGEKCGIAHPFIQSFKTCTHRKKKTHAPSQPVAPPLSSTLAVKIYPFYQTPPQGNRSVHHLSLSLSLFSTTEKEDLEVQCDIYILELHGQMMPRRAAKWGSHFLPSHLSHASGLGARCSGIYSWGDTSGALLKGRKYIDLRKVGGGGGGVLPLYIRSL